MNAKTVKTSQHGADLLYVMALSHEAKALISYSRAKLQITQLGFKLYYAVESNVAILVTGSGRLAMAAGLAWVQHYLPALSAVLNVGVAGHGSLSIGQALLVLKAQDKATQKVFYPHPITKWSSVYSAVCTVDQPSRDYQLDCAYDMEASAFFETARRFLNAEAIQSIKVISDNPQQDYTLLTPHSVTELVTAQLGLITAYAEKLRYAAALDSVNYDQQLLQAIDEKWPVSVSQRQQLINLLTARQVLTEHAEYAWPQIEEHQQLKRYIYHCQQWVQAVEPRLTVDSSTADLGQQKTQGEQNG